MSEVWQIHASGTEWGARSHAAFPFRFSGAVLSHAVGGMKDCSVSHLQLLPTGLLFPFVPPATFLPSRAGSNTPWSHGQGMLHVLCPCPRQGRSPIPKSLSAHRPQSLPARPYQHSSRSFPLPPSLPPSACYLNSEDHSMA